LLFTFVGGERVGAVVEVVMIDWARVEELRSEIGDDGLGEVLELFLDEVELVVMRLGQKPEKLEDDLHFLKGSAWNLGFAAFGAICNEGEHLAARGMSSEIDVPAVLESYAKSKAAFMQRVHEFCESCQRRGAVA
jgi:HPt (histidine-containing phosphotransfer) domain-containing protein